jgi:Mad3/BUB1 homology region 1
MNPQVESSMAMYQNEITQWELAINQYNGSDPLDHWFKYICWLESNVKSSPALEAKFRKSVEVCLSLYDKYENYKQDLRMVKLWIKYVSEDFASVCDGFNFTCSLLDRLSTESLEFI